MGTLMAHASHTERPPRHHTIGWRRIRRRPWTCPAKLPQVYDQIDLTLSTSRAALARLTTSLLDQITGSDGAPNADPETAYD